MGAAHLGPRTDEVYRPTAWTTGQRAAPIRWIFGCPDGQRARRWAENRPFVAIAKDISNLVIFDTVLGESSNSSAFRLVRCRTYLHMLL